MWELDHKESWAPKNQCFQTVVLEKTVESPLNIKHIKLVGPKGNQYWLFTGRTDAEAEAPILWLPDAKRWLIGKDPDAGKGWKQEKGVTRWDGWMATSSQWTRVWVSSRRQWRIGKHGMLQFMESQRVGCNWTKNEWKEEEKKGNSGGSTSLKGWL